MYEQGKGTSDMERVMSVEDKIRRAEEIYYKRRNGESGEKKGTIGYLKNNIGKIVEADRTNEVAGGRGIGKSNEKNLKLLKKMIKQIIVCIIIYGIFYITVNNNYVFSEDFTKKAREILNQDIDFKSVYLVITTKLQELHERINKEFMNNSDTNIQNEEEKNNEIQNNNENNSENNNIEENISENSVGEAIGGANESGNENIGEEGVETENKNNDGNAVDNLSQMEQDANYIKSTIDFIKPIEGKITSGFGMRNPTTASVPKNHTGTDIAAETGTKIVAATGGKVILSSTSGDYGKHLKIQTSDNDVVVVYAHCNNLYVNEGETIKQGQEIAEVGATGNATGPHLHFEVRYQSRYVDPQMILEL